MKPFTTFATAFCLVALYVLAVPTVSADEWNKKTTMTFTEPVEVPGGVVLPPGTYIFALVDSLSDRHIVRVWNKDQTKILATVLAINNYRLTPTDKTVMTFDERPRGTPETLHAWFYPGNSFGQEFVYPKDRAVQLAVANKVPVLAVRSELPADIVALKEAPVVAITPEQTEVPVAQVVQSGPATTLSVAQPTQLPKTASSIPELLMFALLCIVVGVILRRAAKRNAATATIPKE